MHMLVNDVQLYATLVEVALHLLILITSCHTINDGMENVVVNNQLMNGVSFNLESWWSRCFICHYDHLSKYTEGVAHIQL